MDVNKQRRYQYIAKGLMFDYAEVCAFLLEETKKIDHKVTSAHLRDDAGCCWHIKFSGGLPRDADIPSCQYAVGVDARRPSRFQQGFLIGQYFSQMQRVVRQ